ncbi:metallophosphoesterase family protein [Chitinophaga lutea]|uniref:Metallophosphoesterase family protein n=1 Tax=Chitinophaga lutea TaxID=2488634 RepID=A0A3N4PM52_9BACT|nr:metallophosphoesterase family protein [Chitinophaga lutea]RPE08648.1 metallophosphoesterase family protein [Chitinophaga lutea]
MMKSVVRKAFSLMALAGWMHAASAQTSRPDRIVLNVTENMATSAAATWRTATGVTESFAEIMPADADPRTTSKAVRSKAVTTPLLSDTLSVHYHSAVFHGLQPNTLYAYRVGQGDNWSEWFQFRTAAATPQPFTFIYLGDAQANLFSLWSRTIRKAYEMAPDARLILHAGDLVNRGNRNAEWQEWFEAGGYIHSTVPGLMSPGNHEYYYTPADSGMVSAFWRPQFTLPENGPEGLEETCYYTDVQGVRFISLNSQEIEINKNLMARQRVWLEKVLKDNPNQWTCIVFHHPVLSTKSTRDNKMVRENFKPLFDTYKVDLVMQGHDHTYARGLVDGTMYVVSVSGPKMYPLDPQPWMQRTGSYTQLFQLVHVNGGKLRFESYTTTGQLFDAFELQKKKGARNTFTSKAPAGTVGR